MEASSSELKLSGSGLEELLKWLDSFALSRACRKLSRDFSDGVLVAEILKAEFPGLVELHNYAACCSLQGKLQNWNTLNRKVLTKLQLRLRPEEVESLANAESSSIEALLVRLMKRVELVKRKASAEAKANAPEESSGVMTIRMARRMGDKVEQIPLKVIAHSKFAELEEKVEHQRRIIAELEEKTADLLEALDWKSRAIKELEQQTRQPDRKLSMSAIKESLTSLF